MSCFNATFDEQNSPDNALHSSVYASAGWDMRRQFISINKKSGINLFLASSTSDFIEASTVAVLPVPTVRYTVFPVRYVFYVMRL